MPLLAMPGMHPVGLMNSVTVVDDVVRVDGTFQCAGGRYEVGMALQRVNGGPPAGRPQTVRRGDLHAVTALPVYADDLRVYLRSGRAAQRRLQGVADFLERRLRLQVNTAKSSVTHASISVLAEFRFYFAAGGASRVRVEPKAWVRMRPGGGADPPQPQHANRPAPRRAEPYITGWCANLCC